VPALGIEAEILSGDALAGLVKKDVVLSRLAVVVGLHALPPLGRSSALLSTSPAPVRSKKRWD
jgi:hypothetical protein